MEGTKGSGWEMVIKIECFVHSPKIYYRGDLNNGLFWLVGVSPCELLSPGHSHLRKVCARLCWCCCCYFGGWAHVNCFHLGIYICAKLHKAMLLFLELLGGANSTLLDSSINTLLTYLQVNSSLVFTSHNTIA